MRITDGPKIGQPPTVLQSADAVELNRALAEAQERIRALEAVIEADRTRIIDGVNTLEKVLRGRFWLTEGRGSYEWNDDRYRKEFGDAARAVLKAVEPLRKIGADLTNCPPTTAEVLAARRNKDAEITRLAGDVLRYKETSENYLEAIRKFDAEVLALEEKLAQAQAELEAVAEELSSNGPRKHPDAAEKSLIDDVRDALRDRNELEGVHCEVERVALEHGHQLGNNETYWAFFERALAQRDARIAELERALREWSELAEHLDLSTQSHRNRTRDLLASTAPEHPDTRRLNKLQALFDREKPYWPLIGIQTIKTETLVGAYNDHHGNETGLVYGATLREAIDNVPDAAMKEAADA